MALLKKNIQVVLLFIAVKITIELNIAMSFCARKAL